MDLLVEPAYRSPYPPLGLLKIASCIRSRGGEVQLVKGKVVTEKPNRIYVTSLFTWEWKAVWDAIEFYKNRFPDVEVVLGGIYASLMSDHAAQSGADQIVTGLCPDLDNFMPAYDLVPEWDGSMIFSSRGCVRACKFCPVGLIEGKIRTNVESIKPFIYPGHKRVFLFDNNIIGSPNWDFTWSELMDLKMKVHISEGIDARLVTEEIADQLAQLRLTKLQTAYDNIRDRDKVIDGIKTLKAHITRSMPWSAFVLYNYKDTPEDLLIRLKDLAELGVTAFPMRWQPLDTLEKNTYIDENWTKEQVDDVRLFTRKFGFNSMLLPSKLPDDFQKCNDLHNYLVDKNQATLGSW